MKDVLGQIRAQLADQKVWKGQDPVAVNAAIAVHRILSRHGPLEYCDECPFREITDGIMQRFH